MLFWLYLKVKAFLWLEERKIKRLFYWNSSFAKTDLHFKKAYRFKNPYRMHRSFLQRKGREEIHTYGETPLTTLHEITTAFGVLPEHQMIEMGAGRGRAAFFLASYVRCHVVALEEMPSFVEDAQKLCQKLEMKNLSFIRADMKNQSLGNPDFIYLCGTCLKDDEIRAIIEHFTKLPKKIKIITVSFPLKDYSEEFVILKQLRGKFPWGESDIYLNGR